MFKKIFSMFCLVFFSYLFFSATHLMAEDTCSDPFPLSTEGRYIVDSCGNRFKIKAVNWFGGSDAKHVVGGLHEQTLAHITGLIKQMGFNAVRLPFSNEMLHIETSVETAQVQMNPALFGKKPIEVYDAVVKALTDAGIAVILNNHTTISEWCCGYDFNGMWWNRSSGFSQSTEEWEADWLMLAQRYINNKAVVGADLRNEVRTMKAYDVDLIGDIFPVYPNWGSGDGNDWRHVAEQAGNKILQVNSDLLIVVEGINWAGALPALGGYRPHLMPVKDVPVELLKSKKLVYAAHNYGFTGPTHQGGGDFSGGQATYRSMDVATYRATMDEEWGYVLDADKYFTAPVWISEFGTSWNYEADYDTWLKNFTDYAIDKDVPWAYWALNPDRQDGEDDTYGLLESDWSVPRTDHRTVQMSRLLAHEGKTGKVEASDFQVISYSGDHNYSEIITWDWDSGAGKGTCRDGYHVVGIAHEGDKFLSTNNHFGDLWSDGHETTTVSVYEGTLYRGYDWAGGCTKYECPEDYYVSGVSRRYWGTGGVLCSKADRDLSGTCRTVWFDQGDNRASDAGGDWASGQYKGQCADDEYVGGVAQKDGTAVAILCCKVDNCVQVCHEETVGCDTQTVCEMVCE